MVNYMRPYIETRQANYLSSMTAPRGAGADGRDYDDPATMRSMPSTRRKTATTSAAKRARALVIQTRLRNFDDIRQFDKKIKTETLTSTRLLKKNGSKLLRLMSLSRPRGEKSLDKSLQ